MWVYDFVSPVFFKTNEIKNSNGKFDINPYLAGVSTKLHITVHNSTKTLKLCSIECSFDTIMLMLNR